ncbi:MAG: ribosome silencing factor [Prevotellaceae bacterium]|jgi:ribosome-associated protein|nr:ribosome silencing factor [Prevotellaceae bacterium]
MKIVSIDLTKLEGLVYNHFVVCEGDSTTHVSAIADSVRDYVRKNAKTKPFASDGFQNAQWIVFDYGDILVHIFLREAREFYRLESLWSDAKITEIDD